MKETKGGNMKKIKPLRRKRFRRWLRRVFKVHSPHDLWWAIYGSIDEMSGYMCSKIDKVIELETLLKAMNDVPGKRRLDCAIARQNGFRETEYVTGCEYQLPLQKECRDCPRWSESRYVVKVGEYVEKGLREGITSTTSRRRTDGL